MRSEQMAADSVTYSYTTKGRLNAATDEMNACSTDYAYDAEGRRTGSTSTCTPEPVHSFKYTAGGKLMEHMKSWDGDSGVTVREDRLYWYDALGRRILMHSPGDSASDYGTWRYVWSQGGKLLQVTQADPTNPDSVIAQPTLYLPGTKPNELFGAIDNVADTEKIYVHDAFGNVRTSRDSTGSVVESTGYTAYGVSSGDGQEASGFASDLGAGDLVQFHNRYYDPVTGQFTTEDPIGFAGGSNLYSYAHSIPVNFSDPFGLQPTGCCLDLAIGLSFFPVSARGEGKDVILSLTGGGELVRSGGTRAWRNNNPGNLRPTPFSTGRGSLGEAGGFAVFGAERIGERALISLLTTETYQSLSVNEAIARYAPPSENDTGAYQDFVQNRIGIDGGTLLPEFSLEQLKSFAGAIRSIEGWKEGAVNYRSPR